MKLDVLSERTRQGRGVQLLVRLTAPDSLEDRRRPVNLALAIDCSSSMRGPRLRQAVAAASELMDRLGERDRMSIVAFDAVPTVICEVSAVTSERRIVMKKALESLETGVGTNLGAALRTGADLTRSCFVRQAISRVLILTDGQPSVGIIDSERLGAMAEEAHDNGVAVTTMGLGQGFDEDLLVEMAGRGQGGYYYLADPSDIPAAFGRELEGVFAITAQDTQLKFIPHNDVESVEVQHKLPSQPMQDGLLIDIGDIASHSPRHVLFRISMDKDSKATTAGKLAVTYTNAEGKPADAHIVGIPLQDTASMGDVQTIVAENLRLRVANAADLAWARRTSDSNGHALLALREVHQAVRAAQEAHRVNVSVAEELLEDLASAEIAINHGAEEREQVRRGLREKSQLIQVGHSVIHRLRGDDL